jgi:hypothetical protein
MHNNASPLTAAHSAGTLWKPKCDVMAHYPYSLNLTLSDCQLLNALVWHEEAVNSPWIKK